MPSTAGAAARRHGVPDPGRKRGAGLWVAGPVRALDGQLRVRHLRLCLDLGAADRTPLDLGLGTAAQRFIPEYREHGTIGLLRGFIAGSRWLAFGIAIAIAALCAGGVRLAGAVARRLHGGPALSRLRHLPAYALANIQDGIARSHDWVGLGLVPTLCDAPVPAHRADGGSLSAPQLPMNAVTGDDHVAALRSGCRRSASSSCSIAGS